MRKLDWVDTLAGISSLEPQVHDGHVLIATGGWTHWPWWARLEDLLWSRVTSPVVALRLVLWYIVRHGAAFGKWGTHADGVWWPTPVDLWHIAAATRDIDLCWQLQACSTATPNEDTPCS